MLQSLKKCHLWGFILLWIIFLTLSIDLSCQACSILLSVHLFVASPTVFACLVDASHTPCNGALFYAPLERRLHFSCYGLVCEIWSVENKPYKLH